MSLRGKKLGVLISVRPSDPNFDRGLRLVATALEEGVDVYLYCIDDAVSGVGEGRLQALKERGAKIFACAYGAHRRGVPIGDQAIFAGLTVVNDIVTGTDRFVSFN